MAQDGEAISQLVWMIAEDPVSEPAVLPLADSSNRDCCGDKLLDVFGDTADSDPYKNDVNGFLFCFPDLVSSATLYLQEEACDGSWSDVVALTGTTYGTAYTLGFLTNTLTGEKYVGYQLAWRNVLNLHGTGVYRIRVEIVSALSGTYSLYSTDPNQQWYGMYGKFRLRNYFAPLADRTVRFEYRINRYIGNNFNDKVKRYFEDLNWYNSLRLRGIFKYQTSSYSTESIKYTNGLSSDVKNEQTPEYLFQCFGMPSWVSPLIRTDLIQADSIQVTDYNRNNTETIVLKEVRCTSEYTPKNYDPSALQFYDLKFTQGYNNLQRKRC